MSASSEAGFAADLQDPMLKKDPLRFVYSRWFKTMLILFFTPPGWLVLGIIGWPFFFRSRLPNQDTCSFGPVSNAEYLEFLAVAQHRGLTSWDSINTSPDSSNSGSQANIQYLHRFRELAPAGTSIYQRLAVMHAIMRASGAVYVGWSRRGSMQSLPYPDYKIDNNFEKYYIEFIYTATNIMSRIPIPRITGDEIEIDVDFVPPDRKNLRSRSDTSQDGFSFSTHVWNVYDWPAMRDPNPAEPCPPAPSEAWVTNNESK